MARQKKIEYEYLKDKNLYRKRVQDQTGQFVAFTAKTPERLKEKLLEFEMLRSLSKVGRSNPLFSDYFQEWFELYSASLSFGGKTDYQSIIKCNIMPILKNKRLLDIKPNDILAVMCGVSNKSTSVFNKTYQLMQHAFSDAYKNGDILKNPCSEKPKGGIPCAEKSALTDEQVETLLNAVKDTRAYPFCMIGIYSGLRREEILGLQWDCVHLGTIPSIEVKRAVRFEHNQPVMSDKLKTKASKRVVPIPPQLVDCLRQLKTTSSSEYVISNSNGGPLSGTQFKNLWHAVICRSTSKRLYHKYVDGKRTACSIQGSLGEKAYHRNYCYSIDFDVTPHILRHTYITNLLMTGVDIKTVQYLAGHSKSKITLDIYAHLTYNKPEDIIGKVEKAFANALPSEEIINA